MPVTFFRAMILVLSLLAGGCASTSTNSDAEAAAEQAQTEETQQQAQQAMIRNGDQASQNKDYEAAIAFYREAGRIKATAPVAMRLGYSFQELNRPTQAAKNFQAALQLDPEHAMAWHALGQLYLNNKELEQA